MADSPRRRPVPPHNPGLRELVEGKQKWSGPFPTGQLKAGFRGWHERGYLPHRDKPGLTQFVTFRLADSFPQELRHEWAEMLRIEEDRKRRRQLEAYLDKGRGSCYLRDQAIGKLVEEAFLSSHGKNYDLHAWVVMPNHVHILFQLTSIPMSRIIESWKKFSARRANALRGKRGPFWDGDYWDTYVRDAAHRLKALEYIERNPVKANLVRERGNWPFSSARFRDEHGVLRIRT